METMQVLRARGGLGAFRRNRGADRSETDFHRDPSNSTRSHHSVLAVRFTNGRRPLVDAINGTIVFFHSVVPTTISTYITRRDLEPNSPVITI